MRKREREHNAEPVAEASRERRPGRPFEGLRILDFTWAAAGPVVTTYLASLGADVVKIEHSARPDLMRVSDRQYGYGNDRGINDSPLFNELASMKRSIELDLNDRDDLAAAHALALQADVLVENMRPGKIEKFGLSYDALSARNPGLVMCSVSATGRSSVEGPPGYAPIFWAEGGGAWMTGWPDRNPGLVRGPIDLHAAAFATAGVLALLRRRTVTGVGGYLDCSAIEAVASTLGAHLIEAQCFPEVPVRSGNDLPGMLVNDLFPCAGNDQWVAISLADAEEAGRLAAVLGGDLTADRIAGADGWAAIAAATATWDADQLAAALTAQGIASARSLSMLAALDQRHLYDRGVLQTIAHDTIGEQVVIGLPWTVDGVPYPIDRCAPKLGEHNDDVLRGWLGQPAPAGA